MQIGNQQYPFSAKTLEGGGKISVGTTAVRVSFSIPFKSIVISADDANTGQLYIGNSNVASDGSNAITFLDGGDVLTMDYDDITTPLYIVASVASQNFYKGAIQ